MTFKTWINTFIDEKELNRDHVFEVEGAEWGINYIPLQCLIDTMEQAPKHEQAQIKNMIVRIDFANGNVMPFFEHLAQAIAL